MAHRYSSNNHDPFSGGDELDHYAMQPADEFRKAFPLSDSEAHHVPSHLVTPRLPFIKRLIQGNTQNGGVGFNFERDRVIDLLKVAAQSPVRSRRLSFAIHAQDSAQQPSYNSENKTAN